MCTRYTLHQTDEAMAVMARALARKLVLPEGTGPRFNVTLTHRLPVVTVGPDGPEARGLRWGLVPFFERGRARPRLLPNARAETAATLPSFRPAVAARRCLVPANGFFEWRTAGKMKLPHLFTLRGGEPFAFAGIWEPADGERPATFAILTTTPNALVAPLHHRMPVILTEPVMARWLGAEPLPEREYSALTQPLAAERMQVRPVHSFVNNSRHDGPQCLAPPEEALPELPFG